VKERPTGFRRNRIAGLGIVDVDKGLQQLDHLAVAVGFGVLGRLVECTFEVLSGRNGAGRENEQQHDASEHDPNLP